MKVKEKRLFNVLNIIFATISLGILGFGILTIINKTEISEGAVALGSDPDILAIVLRRSIARSISIGILFTIIVIIRNLKLKKASLIVKHTVVQYMIALLILVVIYIIILILC